ncbi:MAG: diadenylate cyclase CdaA [Spirochaetaceae bacterium]|nr:diadenylate cyclase CdaA [Spirochaetaceae bacterium]
MLDWFATLGIIYNAMRPVLDVLILAFLLYKAYDLLSKTQAMQLIKGAGFLALVFIIAYTLRLTTLEWILNMLAPGLLIAVAIVFQPELRKIIISLGLTQIFRPDNKPRLGQLEAVVTAAEILSQQRRGMLVVFPRRTNLKNIVETGTRINGEISSTLIVTVFQFDGPLHDGAMVIQNGKIIAAGCFLPLSEQQDIKKSFGTRHRASLGMSEQSDAVVLVVSEETGAISISYEGQLYYDLSPNAIQTKLRSLLDRDTRSNPAEDNTAKSTNDQNGDSGNSINDISDINDADNAAKKEDIVIEN